MSVQPPRTSPSHEALSADDPHEIGGYRVHARLGSGGMGVVYLAYTRGGRPIALKAVREDFAADPAFRRRFADEVASARRIHGLFTAQVIDSGVDDPVPWLATAYVPGPSLAQVVERHGPLPVRTVLLLVAGIAEALQAIHRAGVVHRDLKPANVLIAEDGPRVIDFGIARAADAASLTGTGLRIGTAAYMAPEQAMGRPVSAATDVFALGALAAHVAGGVPPFGQGPESAALYRVVHEPADLSRVPRDLHDLLGRCLDKDARARPSSDEVIAAAHAHPAVGPSLEFTDGWLPAAVRNEIRGRGRQQADLHAQPTLSAAADAGEHTDPPAPGGRRSGERRRRRGATAAVVAVAAVLAAGAALHYAGPLKKFEKRAFGTDKGARPSHTPSASSSPSSPASGVYVPGYADAELTAPDSGYEFDLKAGKVVPAETSTWFLARDGNGFAVPGDSDAFIASGYALSPADCVRGIETEPVASLALEDLADERPFCVRSPDQKQLVVARLIEAEPDDGAVTVALSRYDRRG
ncbi:hypothetical protein AQI95_35420 [Streptomyces yokosukanensis]|uniref:Protein kinase domain-containing protein n=1 Tax=Streptomyces yokosukanensis TaxID=67386 RepID=A0A101NVE9_9ACTN|nr:serine/threonine-protein kinase [Streptomyces yokosukanensis]KUN00062.1 hypothetical protein AQI95_35420 [Streptomyces yokosukanensis]